MVIQRLPKITRILHKINTRSQWSNAKAEGFTWVRLIIVARSSLSKHKHHCRVSCVEWCVCKLGTHKVYTQLLFNFIFAETLASAIGLWTRYCISLYIQLNWSWIIHTTYLKFSRCLIIRDVNFRNIWRWIYIYEILAECKYTMLMH